MHLAELESWLFKHVWIMNNDRTQCDLMTWITLVTILVLLNDLSAKLFKQKLGEGVKGVYISVDVDCLDPAFAPGVSHMEPGGLSFRDVLNILHNLQADVVAADVVEFNPQRDTVDGMTAMVAAKLVRELTAKISK